ncbi:MAG: hypothetical protein AB7Q97_05175 [Gammaproteobacteria bacterium]
MHRRGLIGLGGALAFGGILSNAAPASAKAARTARGAPSQAFFEAMNAAPLPGLGEFRHQVVLGPFAPDVRRMHPAYSPHGLVLDAGWIYAQFRDSDANIYTCLRKVAGYWTGGLSIFTNAGADQLKFHPRGTETHAGALQVDAGDDRIAWSSGMFQSDPRKRFHYAQTGTGCEWQEGDFLSIRARLLQPGMQWFDTHADGGLYGLHVHQAEGEILGRPVKGWFGYDFIYHPPHRPWEVGPYPNRLEVAYHTLANEYDDGSIECGMLCYGLEGWTFAILSDGTRLTHCARDVDVRIVRRPDGFPEEVLYSFDGVEYHWHADPRGRLVDFTSAYGGAYRGSEGHCQRVGDRRRIVNGLGWIDFFSDDRVAGKLVDRIAR